MIDESFLELMNLQIEYKEQHEGENEWFLFPSNWTVLDTSIRKFFLEEAIKKNKIIMALESYQIFHEEELDKKIEKNIEVTIDKMKKE